MFYYFKSKKYPMCVTILFNYKKILNKDLQGIIKNSQGFMRFRRINNSIISNYYIQMVFFSHYN